MGRSSELIMDNNTLDWESILNTIDGAIETGHTDVEAVAKPKDWITSLY